MNIRNFRILSSIPTNSIHNNTPVSFGSGCFIKNKENYYYFLTAQHAVAESPITTNILLDLNEQIQMTKVLPINPLPLFKFDLYAEKPDQIDFAYQRFNAMPECYHLEYTLNHMLIRIPRTYINIDDIAEPNANEEYGFAGYVNHQLENNPYVESDCKFLLNQDLAYYAGLKYDSSCEDFHFFYLNDDDYEVCDFKGTSGAPILDSNGKLVSLVISGEYKEDKNIWKISGLNLNKLKAIAELSL